MSRDVIGNAVVFCGRLDNREELLSLLTNEAVDSQSPDEPILLAGYRRWGKDLFEKLKGDFSFALFDSAQRELILVRDRMGVRPLHYFANPRIVIFATQLKAILAHPEVPTDLDQAGLVDYFALGGRPFEHQERTCLRAIQSVIPSHHVVFGETSHQSIRYWDFDTATPLRYKKFEDYRDEFAGVFEASVRRRMRTSAPVGVSLSGGLDSSGIYCQAEALRRAGQVPCSGILPISYVCETGSDADERTYLDVIEDQFKISVDRFSTASHLGVVDSAEDQLEAIEAPFLEYLWGTTKTMHQKVHSQGARVFLCGHWGDQMMFSWSYLVDLFNQGRWLKAARHLHEYGNWYNPGEAKFFRTRALRAMVRHQVPTFLEGPLKGLRDLIFKRPSASSLYEESWLRQARGKPMPLRETGFRDEFHSHQARSIYEEARSKYHVLCMEWNAKAAAHHGLEIAFPFLDADLIQFMIRTPGEFQNHQGVPRGLFRKGLRGVLPDPIANRRWKADFTDLVNEGIRKDCERIIAVLSGTPEIVKRGMVNRDQLSARLSGIQDRLTGKTCTDAWEIVDLYGMELWLRFIDRFKQTSNQIRKGETLASQTEWAQSEVGKASLSQTQNQ